MLFLTNQFHDSFECLYLIGHKKYSFALSEARIDGAAFVMFLYEEVYLQTRLFAVPVWFLQESFFRETFSVKNGAANF